METDIFDYKKIIDGLPLLPGVYRFFDDEGGLLYVGKARELKKRVASYFRSSGISPRIQLMVSHIAAIETTVTGTEAEALLLENNLIKSLKPRYNILFRDDKTYPYIVLTGEDYPQLTYFRGTPSRAHQYFGPFPNVYAARETIQLLQKVFRLRTCENGVFRHRQRACLLQQINRCTGPCVDLISQAEYQQDVRHAVMLLNGKYTDVEQQLQQQMEQASQQLQYEQAAVYRDQLKALHIVQQKQFVESTGAETNADVIVVAQAYGYTCVNLAMIRGGRHLGDKSFFPQHADQTTVTEVLQAFVAQHYLQRSIPDVIVIEQVVEHQDILQQLLTQQAGRAVKISCSASGVRGKWLEMGRQNALLALQQKSTQQVAQVERLQQLAELVAIEDLQRIECFDISHTSGEATQASCVVYDEQKMQPAQYRRFNIKNVTAGDDYAAMRQALTRRYQRLSREDGRMPDLLLIDGGQGQLNVAEQVMTELGLNDMMIVGVAKGESRKAGLEQLVFLDGTMRRLPPSSPALHLIQQVRDEAHRFAVAGHRARRGKARTTSSLEELAGVGQKRRRALLAHFGGLQGVKQAGVEQLAQVQGISRALAEKIYQQLH